MMKFNVNPYGIFALRQIDPEANPAIGPYIAWASKEKVWVFRAADYPQLSGADQIVNYLIASLGDIAHDGRWFTFDELPKSLGTVSIPLHLYGKIVSDDGIIDTTPDPNLKKTLPIDEADDLAHSEPKTPKVTATTVGPALTFIAYQVKLQLLLDEYVWVVQITRQLFICNAFFKGHNSFKASNGYALESSSMPEPRIDKCYVRGNNSNHNHSFIAFTETDFQHFSQAVKEYNAAVGPQPVDESNGPSVRFTMPNATEVGAMQK